VSTTQEIISSSVIRGKAEAYTAVLRLIQAELDKHPTTSGQTLDNLIAGMTALIADNK